MLGIIQLKFVSAFKTHQCGAANQTFEYIVVGLGAAGSIAAARLAERGHIVAGFEAGPPLQAANGGELIWGTTNTGTQLTVFDVPGLASIPPQPKNLKWDVGTHQKGIGGDGAHNGMLYLRAIPEDFADLTAQNFSDWRWEDVLPVYRRTEDDLGWERGASHRGNSGPIKITNAVPSKWDLQLLAACKQAGYPETNDFNRPGGRIGCGITQMNIYKGLRCSSSSAFLPIANKNLTIISKALVTRIIFNGKRAVGVEVREECIDGTQQTYIASASREVIISGGTHNTPRLLWLSGVGPAEKLRALKLPVVADLCVGCTLFNHFTVHLEYETSIPWIFPNPRNSYSEFLQSQTGFFNRTGGGAEGSVIAWLRSPTAIHKKPDIQLRLYPHSGDNPKRVRFNIDLESTSSSGGSYWLTSSSFDGSPPKFTLGTPNEEDVARLAWGVSEARRMANLSSLSSLLVNETSPGTAVASGPKLMKWIREKAEGWNGHWSGTAAMGSVVDEKFRVKGLNGLRVADNSIWPFQTNGNTQAQAWLVGERVADFISNSK